MQESNNGGKAVAWLVPRGKSWENLGATWPREVGAAGTGTGTGRYEVASSQSGVGTKHVGTSSERARQSNSIQTIRRNQTLNV